jgi:RNA polymerase sigma-70 factor, ECF subfamily
MSSSLPLSRFPALRLTREQETAIEHPQHCSTDGPTDEELIVRIADDDSDALGLLFQRYARLVWTLTRRILQNDEETDDLTQDVFLLVRKRATAFDSTKGTVRSLLVQMCYQRALSRRRDLTRRNFYSSNDITDKAEAFLSAAAPSYDESLEARFGKARLQKAFDDLTAEQRETLHGCFVEGYTLEEIAARTGQSYGNVRHHYYRGLDKLRQHLFRE